MVTYELPPPVGTESYQLLDVYDKGATGFLAETFQRYDGEVRAKGTREALWPHRILRAPDGLYIAAAFSPEALTIHHEMRRPNGELAGHREQYYTSDEIVIGTKLVSGGTDPNKRDLEDEGNGQPIFTMEARLPEGGEASRRVRVGVSYAALGQLMVVTRPNLWRLELGKEFFNPDTYIQITTDLP